MNEYDRALATLEDPPALRERASLAALQGNIERQKEALLTLAKGNLITAHELIQLSALQASSADFYTAAMTIRRAEQLLPVKERVGPFIIELKLLVKDAKQATGRSSHERKSFSPPTNKKRLLKNSYGTLSN